MENSALFSEKSSWRFSGVFLVPVSMSEPHTQDLCEAEEESHSSDEPQDVSGVLGDFVGTGLTGLGGLGQTASDAGGVVDVSEPAAVQRSLHVLLRGL